MDNTVFPHRLNGLGAHKAAEQGLRLARTLTGQKTARAGTGQFRTFVPVDMHGFIHSRGGFGRQNDAWTVLVHLDPLSESRFCRTEAAIGTLDVVDTALGPKPDNFF